jgi:hypothetical protein
VYEKSVLLSAEESKALEDSILRHRPFKGFGARVVLDMKARFGVDIPRGIVYNKNMRMKRWVCALVAVNTALQGRVQ